MSGSPATLSAAPNVKVIQNAQAEQYEAEAPEGWQFEDSAHVWIETYAHQGTIGRLAARSALRVRVADAILIKCSADCDCKV